MRFSVPGAQRERERERRLNGRRPEDWCDVRQTGSQDGGEEGAAGGDVRGCCEKHGETLD